MLPFSSIFFNCLDWRALALSPSPITYVYGIPLIFEHPTRPAGSGAARLHLCATSEKADGQKKRKEKKKGRDRHNTTVSTDVHKQRHPHDTDQVALIVIVPVEFGQFLCHLREA